MREAKREAAPEQDPKFSGARFMIRNYLTGAAIGGSFSVLFLAADIGQVRTLALGGEPQWLALALLTGAMALTFAGLYTAAAIMLTFRD